MIDMFFVSLFRPTREDEAKVCRKGQNLGFNYKCPGGGQHAPPLPPGVTEDGWWTVDRERVKIGYGRKTYDQTKQLLSSWGQFQLPWAQVQPDTKLEVGGPVCVAANVLGLWTAVPLQMIYKQEANWKDADKDGSSSSSGSDGAAATAASSATAAGR